MESESPSLHNLTAQENGISDQEDAYALNHRKILRQVIGENFELMENDHDQLIEKSWYFCEIMSIVSLLIVESYDQTSMILF